MGETLHRDITQALCAAIYDRGLCCVQGKAWVRVILTAGDNMLMWGYMSRRQRTIFAKSLLELGNLAAAALTFGQFISGRPPDLLALLLGLSITATLYLGAYNFTRDEGTPHTP
jgi:hypothetical protein